MKSSLAFATALVFGAGAAMAQDAGDPAAGEQAFNQCSTCHVIADGDNVIAGRGQQGPNLFGLPGRVAGSVEDFNYGDSLVAAGEAGLEWNQEDFVVYTQDPRSFLQDYLDDNGARSRMSFRLRSEEDAANIWAYIESVSTGG